MEIDQETQEKLQELQMLEQNFQNILLQKQAFQLELNESESSIEELKKADDEVYKIIGQVMIKAKKENLIKELEDKKQVLDLRVKKIENQEKLVSERLEKLKQELETKFRAEK